MKKFIINGFIELVHILREKTMNWPTISSRSMFEQFEIVLLKTSSLSDKDFVIFVNILFDKK
jgi:hypothetical protein